MTTPAEIPLQDERSYLVRTHLAHILESEFFRNSSRCSSLLQYSVEHVLNGCKAEDLKERVIGFELFHRESDYDPSRDNIVRTAASDVRKRLAQYYNKFGTNQNLTIEIPSGSYAVTFHWQEEQTPLPAIPNDFPTTMDPQNQLEGGAIEENLETGAGSEVGQSSSGQLSRGFWLRQRLSKRNVLVAIAVVFVTLGAAVAMRFARISNDPISKIWSPLFHAGKPVLVCIAEPDAWIRNPENSSNTKESFVHLTDAFVGVGDAYALAKVIRLLDLRSTDWRLLTSNDTSPQDLRSSPAVLIGAFSNRWSSHIKGGGRFAFDGPGLSIKDYSKPEVSWRPAAQTADWKSEDDYALVSGFLSPETGQPTISLAGVTNYGTEGAADFVTNPELLRNALMQAPPGWRGQNFQFVLHMTILGNTPSPPTIVASYFW